MENVSKDLLIPSSNLKEEEINTNIVENSDTESTNVESVIPEKPINELTITSNFTKCSDILKKPFQPDEEMVEFYLKVKTDYEYKWSVYHTLEEIKQNFQDIYDELSFKSFIFK